MLRQNQPDTQNHPDTIETNSFDKSRRRSLKQMSALLGISLSAESLNLLAVTPASNQPKLFSEDEFLLTSRLADLIIPATETPGALAAEVPIFIDQFLLECRSAQDQQNYKKGLARIQEISQQHFHKNFLSLKDAQQIELLTALENYQWGFNEGDNQFCRQLKGLVLFGYYTSEIGASQELAYLAIPGGYHGNVPFAKVGKAWALNS